MKSLSCSMYIFVRAVNSNSIGISSYAGSGRRHDRGPPAPGEPHRGSAASDGGRRNQQRSDQDVAGRRKRMTERGGARQDLAGADEEGGAEGNAAGDPSPPRIDEGEDGGREDRQPAQQQRAPGHRAAAPGHFVSDGNGRGRISGDGLMDRRDGLGQRETGVRDGETDEVKAQRGDGQRQGSEPKPADTRGQAEDEREAEGAEQRPGEEEDAAAAKRRLHSGIDRDVTRTEQQRAGDQHADGPHPASRRPQLDGDEHRAEQVDMSSGESEQVRGAPYRDVDAEEPVPEVVDRRGGAPP